ncbi:hypothetical protein BBP40_008034 [Aspergillus hancockii]|nr:hypothetical protein BBP40_008034 [Aspergillus hancockii]
MASQTIRRLLIANRGEIAVRIIQAARELSPSIETFALYTDDDRSHCGVGRPHNALRVPSAAAYLDISLLVDLVRRYKIDTVHPGYGFLSESANFARRMHDVGVTVIGPGAEILARTGDKLEAKQLATQCNQVSYPVMIKAVDGGGGRGIRLVRKADDLESTVRGAINESPSQKVFVEKAAIGGFHHLEVQVVGDGSEVCHLWERDCSLQRRFQKMVEFTPSLFRSREVVQQVVNAALRIANTIRYRSLGTVEFLVHEQENEFYFLEINPRLQVEHTVTENTTGVDLVRTQLQLAMGLSLTQIGLPETHSVQGHGHSIQLRLCAENPKKRFSLSIGKITEFIVPSGNGVRVDTHVDVNGSSPVTVDANFDNLLAKIIVTASSWEAAVSKAQRVLADTKISGVQTNLNLLQGIVAQEDFLAREIDTQWLERHLERAIQLGDTIAQSVRAVAPVQLLRSSVMPGVPTSNLLFRRGDAWSITLEPLNASQQQHRHHLQLTRVLQNDFPSSIAAEIEYYTPFSATAYRLQLASTSTTASAPVSASHRRGDPHNPRHIVLPLSGKLIEVLVAAGDVVVKNQVVAFVKQMKMELEVRSPRAGRTQWVYQMEDEEEDVAEGMLLVELEEESLEMVEMTFRPPPSLIFSSSPLLLHTPQRYFINYLTDFHKSTGHRSPTMENLNLYILTFNCARNLVDVERFAYHFFDALPLTESPSASTPPDLLVLSLQEIAPIAYAFLGGSYLDPYFALLTQVVQRAVSQRWDADYVNIVTDNSGMTGLMVFARSDVAERISAVDTARVGLGVQEMGNKGAVGARLTYATHKTPDDTVDLTFVAAHLAPMECAAEVDTADPRHFSHLLKEDQLSREMQQSRSFHGLSEAPINFPPTYKYTNAARHAATRDDDSQEWLWTSTRWPSWCDRVLYRETLPGLGEEARVKPLKYNALPLFPTSDHRAVVLSVSVPVPSTRPADAMQPAIPFRIDPKWASKRDTARRKEFVVGCLAYLGLTWEGNGLLVASVIGVLGAWLVLRSLLNA